MKRCKVRASRPTTVITYACRHALPRAGNKFGQCRSLAYNRLFYCIPSLPLFAKITSKGGAAAADASVMPQA